MPKGRPIRTPFLQHWRRIRYQLVPVLVFCGTVPLVGWLWQRHSQMPALVGEVQTLRVPVRSQFDGVLALLDSGPLELLDAVREGQVVARLDDAPAQAALEALKEDVRRLEGELAATAEQLRQDQAERAYDRLSDSRRLAVDVEGLRLTSLGLQAAIATDKVALEQTQKLLEVTQKAAGVTTTWEIENARLNCDRLQEQIRGNTASQVQAELDLKDALARQKAYPATQSADVEAMLAPIRRARAAAEARVRELELQVAGRTIRAPIDGVLCSVICRPGQTVRAGEDLLVIAAERSAHVVTYVRQYQRRIWPTVGAAAVVASRTEPGRRVRTEVLRVGAQVELVPPHQCADPKMPEWGLPVLLALPPDADFRPGELVNITFAQG